MSVISTMMLSDDIVGCRAVLAIELFTKAMIDKPTDYISHDHLNA